MSLISKLEDSQTAEEMNTYLISDWLISKKEGGGETLLSDFLCQHISDNEGFRGL